MTNGDTGSAVAGEILSSIAETYDWPDFRPVEKSAISVSPDKLAAYAGEYQGPGNFLIHVTVEKEKLYIQAPGASKAELLPSSEDVFFDPDGTVPDIHFTKAADGNLQLSGGGMVAKRVR